MKKFFKIFLKIIIVSIFIKNNIDCSGLSDQEIMSLIGGQQENSVKTRVALPSEGDLGEVGFGDLDEQSAIHELYLQATYLHAAHKFKKSFEIFKKILAHKKHQLYIYDGLFRLLFDSGHFAKIVQLYEKREKELKSVFNKNPEIQLIIAQSYLYSNRDDKAEKLFVQLHKRYPDEEQISYYTAVSLLKSNNLADARSFLEACVKRNTLKQRRFLFYFLLSKVCLQQNDTEQALVYIEKSLKLFPRFDRGWLLKAILMEQKGHIDEAIKGYKNFLNLVGREESVERQLIQLLFSQRRFSEASSFLKKRKENSPEYYFDVAFLEFQAEKYNNALSEITKCLKLKPSFDRANVLKIDILLAKKDFDNALKCASSWVADDPSSSMRIHVLFLLKNTPVRASRVIKACEELIENKKYSIALLAALSDIYNEQKELRKGVMCCRKMFALTEDPIIIAKIRFHIGYIYFINKYYKKMERVLAQAIKYDVVSPEVYNLLAYYYAQRGTNLSRALELVDNALQKEQYSPYFLDTKGVILLKMGKRLEALKIFERALTFAPTDKEILIHIRQARVG